MNMEISKSELMRPTEWVQNECRWMEERTRGYGQHKHGINQRKWKKEAEKKNKTFIFYASKTNLSFFSCLVIFPFHWILFFSSLFYSVFFEKRPRKKGEKRG